MSSSGFLPVTAKTSSADLLDDLGPRVVVLVDPVAEALEAALARLHVVDEGVDVVDRADLGEHADHLLVGAAVAGAVEGGGGRGAGRVGVGVGRAHDPHGGGAAVLLVVGVEDEQHVEGLGQGRVGVVAGLGDLPHHRQEVRREAERVVGVDERHADAEAVAAGGQRRHLGDEPDDLLASGCPGRRCPWPRGRRSTARRRPTRACPWGGRRSGSPRGTACARSRG